MHPVLVNRRLLVLYAAAWALLGVLLAALLGLSDGRPWGEGLAFGVPLALLYGLVCLSAWFVCRAAPLGGAEPLRIAGTLGMAAGAASLLWVLAAGAWAAGLALLGGRWKARGRLEHDLELLFVAGILLYLLSAVVHYLLIVFQEAREAERRALELQVLAREAELKALRAQIDPHFLFNSLNSISSLVASSPEAARRACLLLADFLRKSLKLGTRETIPFSEELGLARGYLAVEQVRFGERLGVETRVEPGAEVCLVPPLLLQPLVENAVRHGIASRIEGGVVRIEAVRADGRLRIALENPRDPEGRPARGQGVGLANVRARMEALHPKETRFEVREGPGVYRVEITLPAVEAAE